ncbi:MAG: S8 family serine peptidase [Planctomycetota bacterium]|nr:S8 family serine peptidase [Planctomycetota bacterium]
MTKRYALLAIVAALGCAAACRADTFPSDPYYAAYQWYGPTLGLPAAWGVTTGSPSVTVAILDTGVMADTPDLAGRLLAPLSTTGSDPLDGTTNHHGTWVASVAAMGVNNGIGGAGVGNFTILPITVTAADGTNQAQWIADGIRLAANQGAKVINISHQTVGYAALDDAAAYARSKGALTFVAAGNSNRLRTLTDYANLIFVSGTNAADARWDEGTEGSTWGPYVDLSAPADNIVVADPTFDSGYGLGDGTSFAAPLASGAAALVWSIDPDLTPDEVLNILYTTAVDLGTPGRDDVYGWGRIDIGAAAARAYEISLAPEPGTLVLLAAGLAAPLARRLRRRS